jgi:DNA repair exonuclease SbcCD ATPase subunit
MAKNKRINSQQSGNIKDLQNELDAMSKNMANLHDDLESKINQAKDDLESLHEQMRGYNVRLSTAFRRIDIAEQDIMCVNSSVKFFVDDAEESYSEWLENEEEDEKEESTETQRIINPKNASMSVVMPNNQDAEIVIPTVHIMYVDHSDSVRNAKEEKK